MAVCTLNLSHPFFVAALAKLKDTEEAKQALDVVKARVEQEHTSCGRAVQQFYGNAKFSHLHNKIWKYDWSPPSIRGAKRKSWRLIVVVHFAEHQPFALIAAAFYSKSTVSQLSSVELSGIFDAVIGPTAAPAISGEVETEFRRVSNGNEQIRSMCRRCFESVAVSIDFAALADAEAAHICPV